MTHDDSSAPATKGDLQYFVNTVMIAMSDIERRLRKEWKEDLQATRVEFMRHIDVRFEEWRHDFLIYPEVISDHSKRIRRLEAKTGIA